jgi:hypothetical protein
MKCRSQNTGAVLVVRLLLLSACSLNFMTRVIYPLFNAAGYFSAPSKVRSSEMSTRNHNISEDCTSYCAFFFKTQA